MTTTISAPTLQDQLLDAERELQDAQRAVGAARLDGARVAEARKRESDARAEVDAIRFALEEADHRGEEARKAEAKRQSDLARWRWLAWHAEHVERIRQVLEARAKLERAEAHAMELGAAKTLLSRLDDFGMKENVWLDEQAGQMADVGQLTHEAETGGFGMRTDRPRAQTGSLTVADCAAWSKRLKPVVAQAAKEAKPQDPSEDLPWNGARA